MKTVIQQIFEKHSTKAIYLISNNPDLWNWVLDNCDPNCLSNKTKIYTAVTGEPILCPCGSGKQRKYITFKKGLSFCGRAGVCSAARAAVSQSCKNSAKTIDKNKANIKRSITNQKRYGVNNIGQSVKAKNSREKVYQDKTKVKEIQQKIRSTNLIKYGSENITGLPNIQAKRKQTVLEKYGVEHPAQSKSVKDKTCETNISRYGYAFPLQAPSIAKKSVETKKKTMLEKYGRTHETQIHIGEQSWAILSNKEQFGEMLSRLGRTAMAKELGVSVNLISVRHYEYGLNILHQNFSSAEIEITNWIRSMGLSISKDTKICDGKELDILIQSHTLAIEFDGLYWHSERQGKNKNYHLYKTQKCSEQNIQLIHIFEDEWENHQDICKSIIAGYLNQSSVIIPARKCKIVEADSKHIRHFLSNNHLQGPSNSSINLALEYNGEIVMAMTFGKPRYNSIVEWELHRLATKCNTKIIGGANRLWNYFLQNNKPSSVVSYCDRRWFTGTIYKKLNFICKKIGQPTYWYTDYINRFHRSRFTKKNAIKLALLNENNKHSFEQLNQLTEQQIAKDILGLDWIWDCGQDTWIWTK